MFQTLQKESARIMNNLNQKVAYYPIRFMLYFLIVTEILFFVGPIAYNIRTPFTIAVFFAIVNLALFWGYKKGIKNAKPTTYGLSMNTVKFLLILGFALQLEYMVRRWATHGLDVSLSSLILALTNPGDAYHGESLSTVNVNIFTGIILTPFRWMALPLGIYYWKQLGKFYKIIVIITGFIYVLTWLGIGTRKGLLDIILFIYFLVIAANTSWITDKERSRKIRSISIGLLVAFVAFFIFSNLSRSGLQNFSDLQDLMNKEYRPFYSKHVPIQVVSALSEITSYLCQGYQALIYSLSDIGIIPITFGGSNMIFWLWADRFFGYDPVPDTYQFILERDYGIDMYQSWHSIYVWIANDFTFIGVPIIIFFIGYIFAKVWIDCVNKNNPFAYPVFAYLLIMVFYFFANNQVLSFNLESFTGCCLIYLICRTKSYR